MLAIKIDLNKKKSKKRKRKNIYSDEKRRRKNGLVSQLQCIYCALIESIERLVNILFFNLRFWISLFAFNYRSRWGSLARFDFIVGCVWESMWRELVRSGKLSSSNESVWKNLAYKQQHTLHSHRHCPPPPPQHPPPSPNWCRFLKQEQFIRNKEGCKKQKESKSNSKFNYSINTQRVWSNVTATWSCLVL